MKKHAILIASALLLTGCSGPAAAPAEAPSSAAATSATSAAAASTPSAAPAAASAPRLTTAETCTELNHFYDPDSMPGGGNATEREALRATLGTLPARASEDLKDVASTISAFAEVALTDAKNDTRELDKYMADTAIADKYRQAVEVVYSTCRPGATK